MDAHRNKYEITAEALERYQNTFGSGPRIEVISPGRTNGRTIPERRSPAMIDPAASNNGLLPLSNSASRAETFPFSIKSGMVHSINKKIIAY
jgi:hypothetical protein